MSGKQGLTEGRAPMEANSQGRGEATSLIACNLFSMVTRTVLLTLQRLRFLIVLWKLFIWSSKYHVDTT